jgi:hypothetical protein
MVTRNAKTRGNYMIGMCLPTCECLGCRRKKVGTNTQGENSSGLKKPLKRKNSVGIDKTPS